MKTDISRQVDNTLKELGSHGSFELPVETYTANCRIFRSLYLHWHEEMEFIFIESGRGLVRLNRETLRVREGDLLIVNRGVLHSMKTDPRYILYYKSIVFDLNYLAGTAGDLCQERLIAPLAADQAEFVHRITPDAPGYDRLLEIFGQIHTCLAEKAPYYYVRLKALFYAFFYEMLAGNYIITSDHVEQHKSLSSIKNVLDYINAHYSEPLSAKELTELSNYSEYYFMKIFRQYTGKTIIEYINDLRLEKSKALLLHSDASVTEVALECGFNNTSYYIKKFQQANGMSPHKFRKNMS
ncbi:MAG: AraC family transcriptional regulator [Bariatricus sp.]